MNKRTQRRLMENAADVESQLVESLNSVATIKRFGLEDFANIKTETRFIKLLNTIYTSSKNSIFTGNSSEFISRLFTIILLWVGSYFVLDNSITPGELLSFYAIIGYFTGPVSSLIGMNKTIQDALIAADRLFELMDLERENEENPFEIFQLWLNLPKKNKKVNPYYKMLWSEDIPKISATDENGNKTEIDLIAGNLNGQKALNPNPDSWAADPENDVQIWMMKLNPNAKFSINGIDEDITRTLYFYRGNSNVNINDTEINAKKLIHLNSDEDVYIENSSETAYLFFLQGKPINEPLVKHGPFVANSQEEIQEAMQEYRKTQFGGWPYKTNEPVHDKNIGRFAKFANGEEVIK